MSELNRVVKTSASSIPQPASAERGLRCQMRKSGSKSSRLSRLHYACKYFRQPRPLHKRCSLNQKAVSEQKYCVRFGVSKWRPHGSTRLFDMFKDSDWLRAHHHARHLQNLFLFQFAVERVKRVTETFSCGTGYQTIPSTIGTRYLLVDLDKS